MSPRPFLAPVLAAALTVAVPAAAQPGDAHGIRVHAACYLIAAAPPRVLAELSCESASDCWGEPSEMSVLDPDTGKGAGSPTGELLYLDPAGNLLAEPPMQGTIRAVWLLRLNEAVGPKRLQLVSSGETMTAAFAPSADCTALPPAAVKRFAGH